MDQLNSWTNTAKVLVEARRSNMRLTGYPGPIPESLTEAYRIQDYAIALRGTTIAGWKVGRIADALVAEYGVNRLAGPIFADTIMTASSAVDMPILLGFAAVEAELMLRVGGSTEGVESIDDVPAIIDEVRIGFEIASSPYVGINDNGPAVTASDFGNNFGLVLGPVVEDWRSRDLLGASTVLSIDGAIAGQGRAADMLDGPFGAVAFIIQLMRERDIALEPGTWISTGAITGIHLIQPGQSASAVFDGRERVDVRITAPR